MRERHVLVRRVTLLAADLLLGACGSATSTAGNQGLGVATTPTFEPPPPGPERQDDRTGMPDPWETLATNPNTGTSEIGLTCWLRFELFRITTLSRLTLPDDLDAAQRQTSVNIEELLSVPLAGRAAQLQNDERFQQVANLAEADLPFARFAGSIVDDVGQLSSGKAVDIDFADKPETEAYLLASQAAPECVRP